MIVVDTNMLVQAVFDTSSSSARVLLRDAVWAAPRLWRTEFRSALAGEIRVKGLSSNGAIDAFVKAQRLVAFEREPVTLEMIRLIVSSRCSACDLEFVAVAQALGVQLVTNDKQVLAEFPGIAISPEAFAA